LQFLHQILTFRGALISGYLVKSESARRTASSDVGFSRVFFFIIRSLPRIDCKFGRKNPKTAKWPQNLPQKIALYEYFCCSFPTPFGVGLRLHIYSSCTRSKTAMHWNALKVGLILCGLPVTTLLSSGSTVPSGTPVNSVIVSPFPTTGGNSNGVIVSPFPTTGGETMDAVIVSPFPTTGGKNSNGVIVSPFPTTGGETMDAVIVSPFPTTGGKNTDGVIVSPFPTTGGRSA
jgi:hypothetical protein